MIDCQVACDACRLLEAGGRWCVQLHTVEESLARLRPEWESLIARSDEDIFFLRNEWQSLWWTHFGAGYTPRIITVRGESGQLAGIAPLMAPRHDPESTLSFIGGTEVADYLDLIVDRAHADEVRAMLMRSIRLHLPWHTIDLHDLPGHSGTVAVVQDMEAQGIQVVREVENVAPTVALGGSWDAYLASLSKKDRHELRRKLRRAVDDLGAQWRAVRTTEDLGPALGAFIQLHRQSSATKAEFMTDAMAAYFHELSALALERGWLRMGVLWVGEQPVSTAMGFAYGDRLYLYNSGYDPAYATNSVGIAAIGLLLRDAAGEGLAIFDFLQGNESYKYMLGAQDHPIYRMVVTRGDTA